MKNKKLFIGKTIKNIRFIKNLSWCGENTAISQLIAFDFTDNTSAFVLANNPTMQENFYANIKLFASQQEAKKHTANENW